MLRRIALFGMLLWMAVGWVAFQSRPALAADLAPGLTEALFKTMDGDVDRAMAAYNAGDAKKFYADYSKALAATETQQVFDALYTNLNKKTWGNFKSKTLTAAKSTVGPSNGVIWYSAVMDKGTAKLAVNFVKEGSDWKIQQIQFFK